MEFPPLSHGFNVDYSSEGHLTLQDPEMHGCAVLDVGSAQRFEVSVTPQQDDAYHEERFAGQYCVGIIGIEDLETLQAPDGDDIEDAREMVRDVSLMLCVSTGSFKFCGKSKGRPHLYNVEHERRIFPGSLTCGRTLKMEYARGRLGYRLGANYAEFPDALAAPLEWWWDRGKGGGMFKGKARMSPLDFVIGGKGQGAGASLQQTAARGKGRTAEGGRTQYARGVAPVIFAYRSRHLRAGEHGPTLKVEVHRSRGGSVSAGVLSARAKALWEDRAFTDCVVECAGQTFHAHRAVLCAASPVFRAAFNGAMQEASEARFEVRGCELPRAVEALLEFIYTGHLPELDSRGLAELLPLAVQYEVQELAPIVAACLADEVTVQTVRDTVKVVKQFSEHEGVSEEYSFLIARLKTSDELLKEALV